MKNTVKELKKLATKSNNNVINNSHTILDTLVITTMTLLSFGTENGLNSALDKIYHDTLYRAEKYVESLDSHDNEDEILLLCKSIYTELDRGNYETKNPIGYGTVKNFF